MLRLLDWTMFAWFLLDVAVTWGAARSLRDRASWLARDAWVGLDKADHVAWSLAAFVAIRALGVGGIRAWLLFALVAYTVEVVQLGRYATWDERGRPSPRPAMCDGVSWKDLLADLAGALLAAACLARIP